MKKNFVSTLLIGTCVILMSLCSISLAEEKWHIVQDEDGRLVLTKNPNEDKYKAAVVGDLDQLGAAWANQDVYYVKDVSGDIKSVYSIPAGSKPDVGTIAAMQAAGEVVQASGPTFVEKNFPSKETIKAALETLLNNGKDAVCGMENRPTEFGSAVDISAGVLVSGRIEFNAKWLTKDIC